MGDANKDLDDAVRSAYEGAFIDAADIMASGDVTLTIKSVVAPNVENDATGKLIKRAIVAFANAKKRFILNKTNAKIIGMHHGSSASQWSGKRITLTVRILDEAFLQRNVPVVRVLPPVGVPLTVGMRRKYGEPLTKTASRAGQQGTLGGTAE